MVVVQQKTGSRKIYIAIIIVLVAALAYSVYASMGTQGNPDAAVKNVQDIYKLLTERDVETLSVKEESGVYRVVIRTMDFSGNTNVQDLYVTKDGKLLTDRFLKAVDYKIELENNKNFIDCLANTGLRVVGISTHNLTILQMQALGNFWYKIYFDCGTNLQICQQLNITSVPSVIYNMTIYEGIKPPEWFEALTGCNRAK